MTELDFLRNRPNFYLEIYDLEIDDVLADMPICAIAEVKMFFLPLALAKVGSNVLYFSLKERHEKE